MLRASPNINRHMALPRDVLCYEYLYRFSFHVFFYFYSLMDKSEYTLLTLLHCHNVFFFCLAHISTRLRSGHIRCSYISHILGWNLSFCHADCIMLMQAWWISSLAFAVSLVTEASLPHPSSRPPIWEHLCWPCGLSDLAVTVQTHGQNCCAGWDGCISMSSNCLGPHVQSTWGEHTRIHPN